MKFQYSQKLKMIQEKIQFSDTLRMKGVSFQKEYSLTCCNYSIICGFKHDVLDEIPNKLYAQQINITNNIISLSNFVSRPACKQNMMLHFRNEFQVAISNDAEEATYQYFMQNYYKCIYDKKLNIIRMNLKQKEKLTLNLKKMIKPKFAKTLELQKVLSGNSQDDYGILTMDQLGRILVQTNQCQFPAIGLWYKCQNLQHPLVYMSICKYLRKTPSKIFNKIGIKIRNQNYIAFAKLQTHGVPELFFVSWSKQQNKNTKDSTFQIPTITDFELQFNKQNLQFTLRGDCNLKQQTFLSPNKNVSNLQFESQLQKIHHQESPQFSSIKKFNQGAIWFEQKNKFIKKIEEQQKQIQRLNIEVQKLNKELNTIKKYSTLPQKPLANFKSPFLMPQSATPGQKTKKLSQSDLQISNLKSFTSSSTKQKKSIQLSQSNSLNTSKSVGMVNDQDPWDMMQIIE